MSYGSMDEIYEMCKSIVEDMESEEKLSLLLSESILKMK
jgi:hypothetical protein